MSLHDDSWMRLLGLIFGALILLLALASTVSKVTLSIFNPWLGRQVRYRDHPKAFIVLVFLYWLMGATAVVIALVDGLMSR